jgi:hypothetical protein
MRKIATIILALSLSGAVASAQGQLDFNNPSIPIRKISDPTEIQSGHSFSATIIGLEYAHERALGNDWSLIFRFGAPCVLKDLYSKTVTEKTTVSSPGYETSTSNSNRTVYFSYGPRPAITIEPRYYHNMDRRYLNGKKTANNCANFFAVQNRISMVYFSPVGVNISIIPEYGIRRGGDHWFREYTFGVGFHTLGLTIMPFLPHIGFRLGYTL